MFYVDQNETYRASDDDLEPEHDSSMYNHAMTRMRDYSGQGGMGVGMHEARHWHRRAYGGLVSDFISHLSCFA